MKRFINILRQVSSRGSHLATATFCIAIGVATAMIVVNSITEYLRPASPEARIGKIMCVNRIKTINKKDGSKSYGSISLEFAQKYMGGINAAEKISIYQKGTFSRISGAASKSFRYISCDAAYWDVFDFEMVEGRPFTRQEFENKDNVAVISSSLYKQLTDTERQRKKILYQGRELSIIGIVSDANSYRVFTNASLWIPYSISVDAIASSNPTGSYEVVYLLKNTDHKARLAAEIDEVERKYNSTASNAVTVEMPNPRTKFDVMVYGYSFENADVINDFYGRWIGFVVVILIIPVLNLTILNYNHIKDRYSEMATMRSFGATKQNISLYFMVENTIVVFVGCFVGYLLSFVFAMVHRVSIFDFERYSELPFEGATYPSILSFVIVLLITLLVSFFSGAMPSYKLAKMNISTALRGGSR